MSTFPPGASEKGVRARAERDARVNETKVVLQVRDLDHARSEEVLGFCVEQLKAGKTYNELRLMLGCRPASVDRVWREIRECLVELVLPATEEEALQGDVAASSGLLRRMEGFLDKIEKRAKDKMNTEEEHYFLKLELEAMRQIMDKYNKRTEHYLKMKDIQKKEKRKTGTTIIFNNLHKVARPGDAVDVTPAGAAKLLEGLDE